jgi:hypothetical protein
MKSRKLELVSSDVHVSLDAPSDPAESVALDDAFRAQQQKIERLNQYYDEVVAELRILLDQSQDEVVERRLPEAESSQVARAPDAVRG